MSPFNFDIPSWELNFFSKDLGKDVTFMLTFEPLLGVTSKQQQLCYKVTTFGAQGPYKITVVYRDQLAYIKAIPDGPNRVSSTTFMPISAGQQTTLIEYQKVFQFTPPIPIGSEGAQALNATPEKQPLALGFLGKNPVLPDLLLYYPEVEPTQTLDLNFTPVLRLYVTDKYKDKDVIDGEVEGDSIWVQNVRNLDSSTAWQLFYEENTGQITVEQYFN